MARKFEADTYSLENELEFIRKIGFCSRVKIAPEDVLSGYRCAIEGRTAWWPDFCESQRAELLAAIVDRMEILQIN